MYIKVSDALNVIEGLEPIDPALLEELKRAMTEDAIPKNVSAVEKRQIQADKNPLQMVAQIRQNLAMPKKRSWLFRFGAAASRVRFAGRRPPLTRRRGDTLIHGCNRGIFALTTMLTSLLRRQLLSVLRRR